MKNKKYIQPAIQVVALKTMGMLAVSGTSIHTTEATGNALGRNASFWDDDDEE